MHESLVAKVVDKRRAREPGSKEDKHSAGGKGGGKGGGPDRLEVMKTSAV